MTLDSILKELPPQIHIYQIKDQYIFPIYGCSGGLSTSSILYLVRGDDGKVGKRVYMGRGGLHALAGSYAMYGVELSTHASIDEWREEVRKGVAELMGWK